MKKMFSNKTLERLHHTISEEKRMGFLPTKIMVAPEVYKELCLHEVYFDAAEQKLFGFKVEVDEDCDFATVLCSKEWRHG